MKPKSKVKKTKPKPKAKKTTASRKTARVAAAPITFYASAMGMPFAIQGKKIASWIGRIGDKDCFGYKTIKAFERDHFPVDKLRLITHGMPDRYIKGLKSALRSARKV